MSAPCSSTSAEAASRKVNKSHLLFRLEPEGNNSNANTTNAAAQNHEEKSKTQHRHVTDDASNDPIQLYIGKLLAGGDTLIGKEDIFTMSSW